MHDNTLITQLEHLLLPKKLVDVHDQMHIFTLQIIVDMGSLDHNWTRWINSIIK